jgi:hypothetical protein
MPTPTPVAVTLRMPVAKPTMKPAQGMGQKGAEYYNGTYTNGAGWW